MSDWSKDPQAQEWLRHVLDTLVPRVKESSLTVSIVPTGETDIKFAVELGLSIMMDKPIVLAVPPGTRVPHRLARVADEILEFDEANDRFHDRLGAALTRILGDE